MEEQRAIAGRRFSALGMTLLVLLAGIVGAAWWTARNDDTLAARAPRETADEHDGSRPHLGDVDRATEAVNDQVVEVRGLVLDENDLPVVGAVVSAHERIADSMFGFSEAAATTTTSGDTGVFRISLVRGGTVAIRATKEGASPSEVRTHAPAVGVTLVLRKGVPMIVRVVNAEGAPIDDATVDVVDMEGRTRRGGSTVSHAMVSAHGGVVRFDVCPGTLVQVTASHEREGTGETVARLPQEEVQVVLRPWTIIRGVVRSRASGQPVVHATIGVGLRQRHAVESDAMGSFALRVPPARTYDIHATAAGFARQAETLAGGDNITLWMDEGGAVTGTLVNADGRPIAGASVHAFASAGGYRDFVATESDATGAFVCAQLRPTVPYTLVIRAPGLPRYLIDVDVPAAGAMCDLGRLVVPRASSLLGRVLDARGVGIADATVVVDGANHDRAVRRSGSAAQAEYGTEDRVTTDDEGRFELSGLAAGVYTATVVAPGRAELTQQCELLEGDRCELVLRFPEDTKVVVAVRDSVDMVVVSAPVTVSCGGEFREGVTGRDGAAAVFVPVTWQGSQLRITVRPPFASRAFVASEVVTGWDTNVRATLRAGSAVNGLVRSDTGATVKGATIRVSAGDYTISPTTDDSGRFAVMVPRGVTVRFLLVAMVRSDGGTPRRERLRQPVALGEYLASDRELAVVLTIPGTVR